jgi:hypothetical protein
MNRICNSKECPDGGQHYHASWKTAKSLLKIKEKDVLKSCLDYLGRRPGFWWRNNTGGMNFSYKGKKGFFRFGAVGSSDILGIRPPSGQLVAIECKGTGGKVSPAQITFKEEIEKQGGLYILARSVDDLINCGL